MSVTETIWVVSHYSIVFAQLSRQPAVVTRTPSPALIARPRLVTHWMHRLAHRWIA